MRFKSVALAIGVASIGACGGGGDGGTNPPPPPTVESVSLSKSSALLEPTETVVITAAARDASGNTVSGRTFTWAASPSSGAVSLTPNGNTVTVTAISPGTAQVTATVDQVTSSPASINVTNNMPTTADVTVGSGGNVFTPNQSDIKAGGTVTFTWAGGPHNVTFTTPAAASGDKTSGTFQVTFPQTGSFDYQCTLHAGMRGTVTVHP